ncbi:DegT/DnrJ/EryC1/StrS family aminotransferase [Lacrimispora brassicae]
MQELALKGGVPVRSTPFPQWPQISENDINNLANTLQNGTWYRGMGDTNNEVDQFEKLYAKRLNLDYGLAVINGTAALNIAVQALDFEPGSEILVSSYTYAASAYCILKAGLKPVFIDIDENTYNIDPLCLEQAITSRTRAIVVVHFGGYPVDFGRILPLAEKYGLKVIEDCAHAHGAEWLGKPVGSWGDIACFSFHSAKNLTCGEGGFIATRDRKLYEKCWLLHNMGRKIDGLWCEHQEVGENYRFYPLGASLLLSQYQEFERYQNLREQNMLYFQGLLSKTPFLKPLAEDQRVTKHGLHLFICRYDSELFHGILRHRFLAALQAEGIPCHIGYKFPLYYNKSLKAYHNECVVAEKACFQESIWFDHPLFLGEKKDIDDIFDAINKVSQNHNKLVSSYRI